MSAVRKPKEKPAPAKLPEPIKGAVVLPRGLVEKCAARMDVRYYLNYVYLDMTEPKKPMLVATNGHVLAAAPVEIEGNLVSAFIPVKAIEAARRVKLKPGQVGHRLIFDGDFCGTGEIMYRRHIDAGTKYPEWRKVVPEIKSGTKADIGINGDYVAMLQNALAGNNKRYRGLSIYLQRDGTKVDPDKAVRIQSTQAECADVIGVVMPVRI